MNKKPDVLVILAIVFGLGILVSTISHGGNDSSEDRFGHVAQQAGVSVSSTME